MNILIALGTISPLRARVFGGENEADMQAAMEEMRRKVEEAEKREALKREGVEETERAKLNATYQKELEKDGGTPTPTCCLALHPQHLARPRAARLCSP